MVGVAATVPSVYRVTSWALALQPGLVSLCPEEVLGEQPLGSNSLLTLCSARAVGWELGLASP